MKKLIIVLLVIAIAVLIFAKAKYRTYDNVTLKICDQNLMGCANKLVIKDKQYLVDAGTGLANQKYLKIVDDLRGQNKLETTLAYVKGYTKKEKGHFPNPMADFDVFHIGDLKTLEEK